MKKTSLYPLLIFIILLIGCISKPHYSSILNEAEKLSEIDIDSSYHILSKITETDGLTLADKAMYGYLLSRIHYKQNKAMAEDSLILYSLQYYKDNQENDKLSLTYFLAANYYKWSNNTENYFKTINDGIEFGIQNQDSFMVYFMYSSLAREEALSNDYMDAINSVHKAIQYNNDSKPSHFYNLGIYYSRAGIPDSANHYFKKSISLYKEKNDVENLNFARRNYADYLNSQGKYKESNSLLYQNMVEQSDTAYNSLTTNYIGLEQLDSAQYYLNKLKESNRELYISSANLMMTAQAVINFVNKENIDWTEIGQYNDSVYFSGIDDKKLLEEKIIIKNALEQKNLLLTINKKQTQLYITWGIILLVIISSVIIIYLRRKQNILAEAEEKQELLERLLSETSEQNNENINFSKKMILQQLGFIKLVATTPTQHNQQLLKKVSLINNTDANIDNIIAWSDFYKSIDTVYDNFYTHISNKFNNILGEKDLQLCCLLRAGFSTKEISILTGQKFQTIYQRKTTIRHKLNLRDKENIVEFLRDK